MAGNSEIIRSNNVLIIVPAYNEELTIGTIVALAQKYGDVLVVDDGSYDRTSEIASKLGAIVIKHKQNRGKGQALRTGFEYALSEGYEVVVTLDADGQHNPDDIPLLLQPIMQGTTDVIIGSRYLKKDTKRKIPLYRRFGLWFLNNGAKMATELYVDSQSGFRAYSIEVLRKTPFDGDGYSAETDILARAKELGFRVNEVPINVRYDVPNNHKKNPLSHGLEVLSNVLAIIGYRRPLLLFGTLSLVVFLGAIFFAYWGLEPYYRGGGVYLTQVLISGLLMIMAVQLLIAGLTLNVLAKMVKE